MQRTLDEVSRILSFGAKIGKSLHLPGLWFPWLSKANTDSCLPGDSDNQMRKLCQAHDMRSIDVSNSLISCLIRLVKAWVVLLFLFAGFILFVRMYGWT